MTSDALEHTESLTTPAQIREVQLVLVFADALRLAGDDEGRQVVELAHVVMALTEHAHSSLVGRALKLLVGAEHAHGRVRDPWALLRSVEAAVIELVADA